MLSGWIRYLRLTAVAKTGVSPAVVVFAIAALVGALTTFILLVFLSFIWLAEHYRPLTAAIILTLFFLLVTVIAGIAAILAQRRTVQRAKIALASRGGTPWLDPRMLGVVLQVGRGIGIRRLVPLVAAGVLAAGFAREWLRQPTSDEPGDDESED